MLRRFAFTLFYGGGAYIAAQCLLDHVIGDVPGPLPPCPQDCSKPTPHASQLHIARPARHAP